MKPITLIATSTFGLEAVVKRELLGLGYQDLKVSEGKIQYQAALEDIPTSNLWLRSADRVLLKMGEFAALTFEELFEHTRAIPWEEWIPVDGKFNVNGKSVKSTLESVSACQAIVKKAVVERLKSVYHKEWFEESGAEFTIQVALLKDVATLTIDTSGKGLTRRGYRTQAGTAPLKETLASALVQLSFWNNDRLLIDPMCGSGTILIEAAMLGKNIAPGLKREFASEFWPAIPDKVWRVSRLKAFEAVNKTIDLQISGYDIDQQLVDSARINARKAGVGQDITFEQKDVKDLWIDNQYGILITNPPYGHKLGEFKAMNEIYISLNKTFRKKTGWSIYVLSADKQFPNYFKRSRPDRVRKLFNGPLEVNYYQYFGERPRIQHIKNQGNP
ncbi:class I SAM-dependent RNA methyltransferase [Chloroflexota bacterium]